MNNMPQGALIISRKQHSVNPLDILSQLIGQDLQEEYSTGTNNISTCNNTTNNTNSDLLSLLSTSVKSLMEENIAIRRDLDNLRLELKCITTPKVVTTVSK
jgi:hypothetical protein